MSLLRKLNFLILFAGLGLFISCEKETNVESCTDGFQNQGETGVDCGGPCAPCSGQSGPLYFYAMVEDSSNFYTNVQVQKVADTFNFLAVNSYAELRFGIYFIPNHDATQDSALMVPNSASVEIGAAVFDQPVFIAAEEQIGAIMVEDPGTNLLEGNFTFMVMNASGNDTINVSNGQFNDVTYE